MSDSDESFVAAFMEQVLAAIEAEFTARNVELPDRRYITFGSPAADCAQLTVALQQLYLGDPGTPPTTPSPCTSLTSAVMRIELLREVPSPQGRETSVPVDKLVASAQEQILDAELLLSSTRLMCGAAWGNMGMFADVAMGAESGMFAGPVMTLTAAIP